MRVEFAQAAEHELGAAADYYAAIRPQLAHDFLLEVEKMVVLLAKRHPFGRRLDARHRSLGLRRFPYSIVYRLDEAAIRIVAVAHHRRGPEYLAGMLVREPVAVYRAA